MSGQESGAVLREQAVRHGGVLGYSKIVVERPLLGEDGKPMLKKGKPVPDAARRDTENVPLTEDIDAYFAREVLPYAQDAWIDKQQDQGGL